jgi:tetraacyldisaccharide-1-P 4'-kinase
MANENIINKIKKEDKLMTSKDLIEFLQFAKKTNMELPTKKILEKLLLS